MAALHDSRSHASVTTNSSNACCIANQQKQLHAAAGSARAREPIYRHNIMSYIQVPHSYSWSLSIMGSRPFMTTSVTSITKNNNNILAPHYDGLTIRCFHSESDYHAIADQTLHTIQDTLDFYFEDNPSLTSIPSSSCSDDDHDRGNDGGNAATVATAAPDITYASGVLTIALSQGTWVLNKQTPNRQIWWSSPISGPRRYEYEDESGKWIWTRCVDSSSSSLSSSTSVSSVEPSSDPLSIGSSAHFEDAKYLGEALKKELVDLFHLEKGLEDLDDL